MDNNLFTNDAVSSSRIIYTPSAFARYSLLHLQECGVLTAIRPHVSSRSGLASYLFFVVVDGAGWLEYDGERRELHAGDAAFIDCRKPYSQSSAEELWTLKWCHFYGPNAASIWNKWAERGGKCVFCPADSAVFLSLLDELYAAAASDSYTRDMTINLKLTELLTALMEQSVYSERPAQRPTGAGRAGKVNISEIKSYIDTNYSARLSLESLARHFYLSKHYLARRFKEEVGVTVNGYIQLVRVGKAKELLRFTGCTVEACALACGYEDPNYFSRQFKKTEGVSPSRFREMWRGEAAPEQDDPTSHR